MQRRRSTTRTSRVDRDMGVRRAGDIQVRIHRVAHTGQQDDPSSTGKSIVEDLAVVAQPQLEDVEGISPQQPVEKGSQEETETLNVLVNEGSSVGAYTLDLIAPPKLNSEITQLPTLEPKRFLRDLRSGKVKQICGLVTDDEYVTDIW
uniref:RxLR effector candidate protein n=1 Tax=Hyaloperonospora arabidopsidis (strain Emoy2) TaxID=559515 RepID=M4BWN0_HYAAE